MSVMVGARLPEHVARAIDARVRRGGFPNRSELVRAVLTSYASEHVDAGEAANTREPQEESLGTWQSCPLIAFARGEACRRCPYKEPFHSIVEREPAFYESPGKGDDLIDQLAEELNREGRKD